MMTNDAPKLQAYYVPVSNLYALKLVNKFDHYLIVFTRNDTLAFTVMIVT